MPVKVVGEARERPRRASDRIREIARDLFYRRGIRAVGIEEIVERAGVTKPTLYRAFSSKDALATSYMEEYDREFWARFDAAAAAHPDDPRAQVRMFLAGLGERATRGSFRGCGLTNACVEYPDSDHPARAVALASKRLLRQRLTDIARALRARDPERLGDGLTLLIEGAYVSGQLFAAGGPARSVSLVADWLIDAACED